MKKTLGGLAAVLLLIGAGCASTPATQSGDNSSTTEDSGSMVDSSAAPQDRLVGTWKVTHATGDFASLNEGTVYKFTDKTNYTKKGAGIETKWTIISLSDTEYTSTYEGSTKEYKTTYHFEGDQLILEEGTAGQVFTLERQ